MAYTWRTYIKALMWYNDCDEDNAEKEFTLYKELGGSNISALNDIVENYKEAN